MSTQEFYNFAVLAAKERGFKKPNIVTISGCFQGILKHSCQLWIYDKRKHINSGLHGNPVSALQAFKDAIEYENKTYSTISEDVNICDECGDGSGWYGDEDINYNCSKCNPNAI